MGTTLKAMKRVAEIKAKRERVLFKKRYDIKKEIQKFDFFISLSGKLSKEKSELSMDIEKTIDVAGKEIVEEDEDVEMDTTEDKAMEMA